MCEENYALSLIPVELTNLELLTCFSAKINELTELTSDNTYLLGEKYALPHILIATFYTERHKVSSIKNSLQELKIKTLGMKYNRMHFSNGAVELLFDPQLLQNWHALCVNTMSILSRAKVVASCTGTDHSDTPKMPLAYIYSKNPDPVITFFRWIQENYEKDILENFSFKLAIGKIDESGHFFFEKDI